MIKVQKLFGEFTGKNAQNWLKDYVLKMEEKDASYINGKDKKLEGDLKISTEDFKGLNDLKILDLSLINLLDLLSRD